MSEKLLPSLLVPVPCCVNYAMLWCLHNAFKPTPSWLLLFLIICCLTASLIFFFSFSFWNSIRIFTHLWCCFFFNVQLRWCIMQLVKSNSNFKCIAILGFFMLWYCMALTGLSYYSYWVKCGREWGASTEAQQSWDKSPISRRNYDLEEIILYYQSNHLKAHYRCLLTYSVKSPKIYVQPWKGSG